MKRTLALFSVVAALAIGCSSTQQKSPEVAVQETAGDRVYRAISSQDEASLERTYQWIMQQDNPAGELTSFFRQLVGIYYRTDRMLKDYDAELDQMFRRKDEHDGQDLLEARTYSRMVAAWILQDRVKHKISFIYKRNLEDVFAKDANGENDALVNARALKVKLAFKATLKQYSDSDPVALHSLYDELVEVAQEVREKLREDKIQAEIDGIVKAQPQGPTFQRLLQREKSKKRNLQVDQEFEQEFIALESDVHENIVDMTVGREPQAAGTVTASAGPSGNMTGNNFRTGRWCLTYDDGPSSAYTPNVLTNLEGHGFNTTFFWLQQNTPRFPTLMTRALKDGNQLGNHSMTHANLPKLGPQGLDREINQSTAIARQQYNAVSRSVNGKDYNMRVFRCPYGACGGNNSTIRSMIAKLGLVHVFWNIDSLDWQDKNPASVVSRVNKAMAIAKKGIILFHDIHPQSVEATRMLMDQWAPSIKNGSMRLLTVPQAIDELNSDAGMQ